MSHELRTPLNAIIGFSEVRERAIRRGITLGSTIDERLGMISGDERKVKQVLLNLLSNALKFTPEGGRIDVRAAVTDGVAEISVVDTSCTADGSGLKAKSERVQPSPSRCRSGGECQRDHHPGEQLTSRPEREALPTESPSPGGLSALCRGKTAGRAGVLRTGVPSTGPL